MSIMRIQDVEFGAELEPFEPDTSLDRVRAFAHAVGWGAGARFDDHEKARQEGLPGALVPGIMSMGFITSMIHNWSSMARVERIDTVFRATLLADQPCTLCAVVTDVDIDAGIVELDVSVQNAAGETRVFGNARVLIERNPGGRADLSGKAERCRPKFDPPPAPKKQISYAFHTGRI